MAHCFRSRLRLSLRQGPPSACTGHHELGGHSGTLFPSSFASPLRSLSPSFMRRGSFTPLDEAGPSSSYGLM